MRVTVLLFAALRETAGADRVEVELPATATLGALKAAIFARWPGLAAIPFVLAVNQDYARDDRPLRAGDEVACVPAISGGSGEVEPFAFTHEAIDPRPLEAQARRDQDGALVTFLGVTRDEHDGRRVERLAYEAYEPMARAKVLAILSEVAARHEVGRILVRHRLGEVRVGETSIAVVVAAPHRAAAFDAAREVMDRIKREVPIFKKEHFGGAAGARWVGDLPGAARRGGE